jgi:predicted phage terminase large subunit-like protein
MSNNNLTLKQRELLIRYVEIQREVLRRKARKSLYYFTKFMWTVIEPETPFVDGWHLEALCEHLEAATKFQIPRLVVNEPPRHMKSILVCVMWPAWVWGKYPNRSFIFGSHSASLAQRDSIKCRQVITSDRYKEVFGAAYSLVDDQNTTSRFTNTRGGTRRAVGVGTSLTGDGADYVVVDDPHDAGEIYSEVARDKVIYWYDKVLSTRVNNPLRNVKVVVMQRLHEMDLCGHIRKHFGNEYDWLILPAEFDPQSEVVSSTKLNFKDPRTQKGEILWPCQWNSDALNTLRLSLGDDATSQLDQNPKPNKGGLFPKSDWKVYTASPSTILETATFIDPAQKPGLSNDYSVIATWAKAESGYYLLDLLREKTDAPLLESLTIFNYNKWKPNAVIIEDKSAGSSLIQYLRGQTTIPVIAFDPLQRDKVVRATAATPTVRAGKCFLPLRIDGKEDGKNVNLVEVFKKEHEVFPRSAHDDMVDTTSMMVEYFSKRANITPRIRQL